MESVLQRQDRYNIHDLPQCNDCRSLFDSLDAHNVWKGGEHDQSKRVFLKQQAHIFKPKKKDGRPSTNWILLEEKLNIQQRIRSKFSKGLQSSTGYDLSPEDYLEGFFRRDHSRHKAGKRKSRSSHDGINDTSNSHVEHPAAPPPRRLDPGRNAIHDTSDSRVARPTSSPPRRRNSSPRHRQMGSGRTSPSPARLSPRKPYAPQYASGPFSVLAALHLATEARHGHSNGRRLLSLTKNQLKRMAQPMCRSNLYDKGRIRGRNAFACMEGLIEKSLVRKEIVRDAKTDGEIEKWGLLRRSAR